MQIGVLGAGAGGCALAYELSNKGHNVMIYDIPDYEKNIDAIIENGGIYSKEGESEKFAAVEGSKNIQKVIESAELIFVVTPAFGTKAFGESCKPYLRKGQKVIICPGSGGGALEFKRALGLELWDDSIIVAETHTLPYAVRVLKPGHVHIFLYVNKLIVATLPSKDSETILKIMKELWGDIIATANNVLETALIDGNPVIHPPVTLMNAALIERTKGDFRFYADGITDSVASVMQSLDEERLAIGDALGLKLKSDPDMSLEEGYLEAGAVICFESYNASKAFEPIRAQDRIETRYLTEDVGYVMVLWSSIAELIGVKVPTMNAIIDITSVVLKKNLRERGPRTASSLGLTKETIAKL